MNYEKQIEKLKASQSRKEARFEKRLLLAKGKVKQKKISDIKKELQKITNKIVRLKYQPICYTCDKPILQGQVQAGHHYSVGGHQATRYDFDNLRVQGSCCNLHASGNQLEFAYKLRKELGDEKYEALRLRAKSKHKWSRVELEELLEERKLLLKSYE